MWSAYRKVIDHYKQTHSKYLRCNVKKMGKNRQTLSGMLRPFYWVSPLIFSLPLDNLGILSAPVPILCGVMMDKDEFMLGPLQQQNIGDDCILVFLDESKQKFQYSSSISTSLPKPSFGNRSIRLRQIYNLGDEVLFAEELWDIFDQHIYEVLPSEPIFKKDKKGVA